MRKMKEMKKAAASVILAAAMVVSMTGCGGSDTKTETPATTAETKAADTAQENDLTGSWERKADVVGLSNLLTGKENEEEAAVKEAMTKYVDPDEVMVYVVFTFNEDGRYTLEWDQEAWEAIKSPYVENVTKGLEEYMTQLIEDEAQKENISTEEVAKNKGYDSVDKWVDAEVEIYLSSVRTLLENEDRAINMVGQKGRYEVADGKLYINTDTSKDIDQENDIYGTYQLQGDELVIDNGTGADLIYHRR